MIWKYRLRTRMSPETADGEDFIKGALPHEDQRPKTEGFRQREQVSGLRA